MTSPAPPRTLNDSSAASHYEEADLEELTRSSLYGSVDELMFLHQQQVSDEMRLVVRAHRETMLQKMSNEIDTRQQEVSRMYNKMLLRRQSALAERENAARQKGAKLAHVMATAARNFAKNQFDRVAQLQSQEQEEARRVESRRKRRWHATLRAALLIGSFGALFASALFEFEGQKNERELQALRTLALDSEERAQARVVSLTRELETGSLLGQKERQGLQAQLIEAQTALLAAEEETREELTQSAQVKGLARKVSSHSFSTNRKKETRTSSERASPPIADHFLTGQCAAGDPLCGTL